ncbi:MAG: LPP20 family lipoprotein [Paramuribaculum sp.]|nr:LPP20 family lipoprotein [Paramuribaculum sp.]
MKRTLIMICACITLSVHAQINIEAIQRDPNYICGLGRGRTIREAENDALQKISSQIRTFVIDEIEEINRLEKNNASTIVDNELVNISTKSFTANTIPNAKRLELSPEPEAVVFRYVHRDDIARMQQKKGEAIQDLIETGKRAEQQLQIDDALRNYYWALLLAKYHIYPVYAEFNGEKGNAVPELSRKINSVILGIKATLEGCEEVDGKYLARMRFTYAGHDVASLQLKYHDGRSMIGPLNVRDGIGELDLIGLPANGKLMLQYIYNFEEEAEHLSADLAAVYAISNDLPVVNSRVDIPVKTNLKKGTMQAEKNKVAKEEVPEIPSEEISTPRKLITMNEATAVDKYIPAMQSVETAIRSQDPTLAKSYFTDAGYDMFETLLKKTGKITMAGKPEYKFIEANSQVLGRYCPIKMRLPNGKTFMEKLVFRFNPISHKIQSIAFALTQKAEADIFDSATPWGEVSRYTILQFMEDYQTAFALKRIDFIEQLFSDKAIIITGSVLQKSPEKGAFDGVNVKLTNSQKVRYRKFTKEQYINNLRRLFKDHYVHLAFEDNTCGIVNTGGILPDNAAFAIQIRQLYTCTNGYADRGYLTLFLNTYGKYPLIEVRLWQPEDDKMPYDEFLKTFNVN